MLWGKLLDRGLEGVGQAWNGKDGVRDGTGKDWRGREEKGAMRNRTEINVKLGNMGKDC